MEEIVIKAEKRDVIGKQVNALRREGKLPCVLYGSGISPMSIMVDYHETNRLLPTISSSHLVVLDVEGEKHTTLIKERQMHPVRGTYQHLDFWAMSMTEKLKASVAIELIGESPAVKDFNGMLVSGQELLEVECLPRDLPEKITVDISSLKEIGDAIRVEDVISPDKVDILTSPSELVVLVAAQAVEEVEEEEVLEEGVEDEPEVIEKGKKEEDEEF